VTALTQKNSGRLLAVALTIGVALALALIALRPAGAASIEPIPSNVSNVCDLVGDNATPFVGESFTFEIPQGSDPTRVFTETYGLVDGATITVVVPTNRKELTFTITDAKVIGFAVFDKTNLRSGQFYDYSPDGTLTGTVMTPTGVERNIKGATVCYRTKADPTIATNGGSSTQVALGMQNTATLTGGDSPTGTITFNVYANSSCTGTPAGSAVFQVTGNGTYGPASITVANAGDYYWQAVYSGDSDNNPAQSPCGDQTTAYPGILACGDTDSAVGDDPGDRASFVEVIRLDTGKEDCTVLLPYTLDITADAVKFLFPDEFDNENFFIRIDWAVSVGTADEILVGSARQVAIDDVNYDDVEACASDLAPGEVPDLLDPPTVTHDGVPICLVAQLLNGVQTQWYSGQFDPQWR
jgi:hypothetical protein